MAVSIAQPATAIRSLPDMVPPPNRTLGWAVLEWTAQWLLQPDGPNAGSPWVFTDEQVRIILRWYEIDDRGVFVQHRGVIRRMKGWGKDPLAAVIACVELCGPCRFGGWDAQGMPIVIKHSSPWIQVAAVTQDQTKNLMSLFPSLFSPKAKIEFGLQIGKEIIYSKTQARIEAVTSSPRAIEGGRPSLVILDETQHWLPNNEGLAMEAAIRRNLGKSRDASARALEITNAHLMDEGSVAEQTYEAWRRSDGQLTGVYYDCVESPPLEDLKDIEQVRAGLLAARGDSTWLNVERLIREIQDPTTTESIARRYYLNQVWATGAVEWIRKELWAACALPDYSIPDGSDVMIAVDGSFNDDSTAVIVASLGMPHLQVVGCWESPPEDPEWRVPILEVEECIRAACKRWRAREVIFDPYRWARTMQVLGRDGDGLPVVEFPQSPERMLPACARFLEAVINGTLTHSGDPRLARHIANVVVKEGSRGFRIVKETKWSPKKIDLAVASVMAHDRAADRDSPGYSWMLAWRREASKALTPELPSEGAAESTPRDSIPAAPTPSLNYFQSPPPVNRPAACQHRWWDDRCVKCQIPRSEA